MGGVRVTEVLSRGGAVARRGTARGCGGERTAACGGKRTAACGGEN
jgi:hypothetical protein